jgi:hypothetical protein
MEYQYPHSFPPQSRAAVEEARAKAESYFIKEKRNLPSGKHFALQLLLKQFVTKVFFVFLREACTLGKEMMWTPEEIRENGNEFLRMLIIIEYSEKVANGTDSESFERELTREIKESENWRRHISKLAAIARAQATPHMADTEKTVNSRKGLEKNSKRELVNDYIEEVFKKTRKRINRTAIWKAAGYKTRTEFERWERDDPQKRNKTAHERFMRILTTEKPHLK